MKNTVKSLIGLACLVFPFVANAGHTSVGVSVSAYGPVAPVAPVVYPAVPVVAPGYPVVAAPVMAAPVVVPAPAPAYSVPFLTTFRYSHISGPGHHHWRPHPGGHHYRRR